MKLQPQAFLRHLFETAVEHGSPGQCLPPYLESIAKNHVHVIGAGKASASMAKVIEEHFQGGVSGTVITRYGHRVPCHHIEVIEAAHPIPDRCGIEATEQIIRSASHLNEKIQVLCVISGGASALMTLPHESIRFDQKKQIHRQLILSGASIQEINCVRKHLSAVKGGRLMEYIHPASALTLCISDVAGNDPAVIGSGPTVADPTTCRDALKILNAYEIQIQPSIDELLRSNQLETPKPNNPIFQHSKVEIIADAARCLSACAREANKSGVEAIIWNDSLEGDTNQAAKDHVKFLRETVRKRSNSTPFVILSGGETTVNVKGSGKGGPNTQFVLALALELENLDGICAIACDTDGIDGSEDNAGAMIHKETFEKSRTKNLTPQLFLNTNDSYNFFSLIGDLVITGPTLTNVNDFRAIYCDPARISPQL